MNPWLPLLATVLAVFCVGCTTGLAVSAHMEGYRLRPYLLLMFAGLGCAAWPVFTLGRLVGVW